MKRALTAGAASLGTAFMLSLSLPVPAFAQGAEAQPPFAGAPVPQKKTKIFKGKDYILFPDAAKALSLEEVIANAANDSEPAKQSAAMRSLGIRGMGDPALTQSMIDILSSKTGLKSGNLTSRYQAAYWLGRIGENHEAASARVMALLEETVRTDPDSNVRATALSGMAITAESFSSAYYQALAIFLDRSVSDPDVKIRKAAMDGLNTIGNEYPGIRPQIINHLRGIGQNEKEDASLRLYAGQLITLLSGAASLPTMQKPSGPAI